MKGLALGAAHRHSLGGSDRRAQTPGFSESVAVAASLGGKVLSCDTDSVQVFKIRTGFNSLSILVLDKSLFFHVE